MEHFGTVLSESTIFEFHAIFLRQLSPPDQITVQPKKIPLVVPRKRRVLSVLGTRLRVLFRYLIFEWIVRFGPLGGVNRKRHSIRYESTS